jgi:hypothetical protein
MREAEPTRRVAVFPTSFFMRRTIPRRKRRIVLGSNGDNVEPCTIENAFTLELSGILHECRISHDERLTHSTRERGRLLFSDTSFEEDLSRLKGH